MEKCCVDSLASVTQAQRAVGDMCVGSGHKGEMCACRPLGEQFLDVVCETNDNEPAAPKPSYK